jgi:predicted DsbA family dithiol-disulfide isomerase
VVDRLEQDYGSRVQIVWQAFELRPEPVPPLQPDSDYIRERWAASVLPMAAERGLLMRIPNVQPRTRLAFQAVELARDHQKFQEMHRALFEAFFRDGLDIGSASVLAQIGGRIGLAPTLMGRVLDRGTYLQRVLDQEHMARDLGIDGVPAMLIGDDLETAEPVIGAVPYPWLSDALERGLSGGSLDWRRRALRHAIPLKHDR